MINFQTTPMMPPTFGYFLILGVNKLTLHYFNLLLLRGTPVLHAFEVYNKQQLVAIEKWSVLAVK